MKRTYLAVIVALLLSAFLSGCGCGGGDVTLVSIAVAPAEQTIIMGATQQFIATGTYSDDTTLDITKIVTWSTADQATATISNSTGSEGLATGVFTGTVVVTATSGDISGTATLTVIPVLTAVAVTPASATLDQGQTQQYAATGTYSDNTTRDITASVTWSSSLEAVAAISNAEGTRGLAAAAAEGTTTITATTGELAGTAQLTVNPLPQPPQPTVFLVSIKVTPENPIVRFGQTIQFTATGTFSDGSVRNITEEVVWTSSQTDIAVISNVPGSRGQATTDHKVGSTLITATQGNVSGSTLLIDP